ncbi:hypothetical protein ACGFIF_39155 [Kribbella sp. NPDC049174]|uniref:hypothetical protein n=1 Tax=Kribbella sp. NPDC049174 TaxID=3364112 RepID=UPI003722DD8A
MADGPAGRLSDVDEHGLELRKEALTMAPLRGDLPDGVPDRHTGERRRAHQLMGTRLGGVTLGLAIAHWFAFRVSARMVRAGTVRSSDVELAGAQLVGAAGVAVVVSVGVLLLPDSAEFEGAEFLLAALISLIGYGVARGAGASLLRAVVYSVAVLVCTVIVAALKNLLAGH